MLTSRPGSRRTSGATEKLSPTAYPGVGYGSCPTISTRTPANGCLNARSTFSPDGRYRRPAATSARRKSPIAAIRPATGSSASAQPGSRMLRNGSAMASYSSRARTFTKRQKPLRRTARGYQLCFPRSPPGALLVPLASGALLRRFLPSSLVPRSSVQAAPRAFGSRGSPGGGAPFGSRGSRSPACVPRWPGPGHLAAAAGGGRRQPGRVAGRRTVLVVVEVGVHLAVPRYPVRPPAERAVGIARPRVAVALVEPQVLPVGGAPQRRLGGPAAVRDPRALPGGGPPRRRRGGPAAVRPAQRRVRRREHLAHLVGPPRFVSWLDRDPHGRRELPQAVPQQVRARPPRPRGAGRQPGRARP